MGNGTVDVVQFLQPKQPDPERAKACWFVALQWNPRSSLQSGRQEFLAVL